MPKHQTDFDQLKEYLLNPGTEKSKDYLVFPLFQKIFGKKFKKESNASGADIYIEGQLLVELKSDSEKYTQGFFQALHYAKKGLSFPAVCVIARKFLAVWKITMIPDFAKKMATEADAIMPPSKIGIINARRTNKMQRIDILNSSVFKLIPYDFGGLFMKDCYTALHEFEQVLRTLDAERIQINTHNFIEYVKQLERFFDDPIDAIHCFYAIVGFWDITSTVALTDKSDTVQVIGHKGSRASEPVSIKPRLHGEFKKFVENHCIFTNEGSGLTVDYYFSRFDQVISRIRPEYAKQHGIFFTDNNLSKFALWFVHEYFEERLSDKYIVLDPAGGSGNLVTSWKGHLKHKIVSELQPDLLKTIERRMKLDPIQIKDGFTIIPKVSKNEGLNFLDKSAEQYIQCLITELKEKNFRFDKPLAFLLNPPYKNTDENIKVRDEVAASYEIHHSILKLTGRDAGKERYLAFLGQIINIARAQMGDLKSSELNYENIQLPHPLDTKKVETPLILIFTPTSWLIPRPTYIPFRNIFDRYFKYENGFIFLGNEFFKIKGRFPIAFTIWSYQYKKNGNNNAIVVKDLTHIKNLSLQVNWNIDIEEISKTFRKIVRTSNDLNLSFKRESIKKWCSQKMYDFKRNPTGSELVSKQVYGGLPLNDPRRKNKKTYGIANSKYVGFMDDGTPVRIKIDKENRLSERPNRVWFYLDNRMIGLNLNKIFSGPPDKYGMCAYDLPMAQNLFVWYAIAKALSGKYPIWANQFDIWSPNILKKKKRYFISLCFALGFAENRCIVTKFEENNPIKGAPEVFVDNPLCPANPDSFWSSTLDKEIVGKPVLALDLVKLIKQLYEKWNVKYCKSEILYSVGLQDEPYFKYFNYKDFLTPYSGLMQIKKYVEIHKAENLNNLISQITSKTKQVREEIYGLLVDDFKYFK